MIVDTLNALANRTAAQNVELDGTIDTTEQLTGLPTPEPEPVDPLTTLLARLADARSLEEVRQAAQEATQP